MPKKKPGLYTSKNGRKYRILANGQSRFVKSTTKGRKKGGSVKVGGSVRKRKRGGGIVRSALSITPGGRAILGGIKDWQRLVKDIQRKNWW